MTDSQDAIRVLLVDDHEVVRAGFRHILEEAPGIEIIGEAGGGREACARCAEWGPDVVLLDLSLPDLTGLEAIRRILARRPDTRVLVLSMYEEPVFAEQALAAGARGYVTKAASPEVLVEGLGAVTAGRLYLEPALDRKMAERQGAATASGIDELSPREFEIFRLLAEGRTTPEIAEALCIGYKTAANHSTRLRAKLGVTSAAELARLALRHGVIASDPDLSSRSS